MAKRSSRTSSAPQSEIIEELIQIGRGDTDATPLQWGGFVRRFAQQEELKAMRSQGYEAAHISNELREQLMIVISVYIKSSVRRTYGEWCRIGDTRMVL